MMQMFTSTLYYYNKKVQCLSVPDQFFLTLIKLRQHKIKFELSRMFCVSESTVTNIFVTWVNFMNVQWREIDLFPSRDLVKYFAPSDFKQKFPTTRIFIDGVECPVKKPSAPRAQQSTFSTYKNRNTVKNLVGCTPGALVSYISPRYGGSVSDRQIIERSHIQISCDPGDSIMADKGHIERIIGLGKTYKILTQPMTGPETNLSSEIIFICYMLCNFRSSIVSKMA
ncbi:PREDICTED: uncharacterized protein LOC106815875 [Priapulus caudatus]|uniref:Uncharacterized protein LOC106815875 n=1 Tax=Priapulus caudatus TaxID=37621 RepID=A0ABM1EUL4_PRICU|nr:PREDICTED: uncharacterized protein LOC106815875 [Priapulus caudatus]XP_014675886.1 PREDICTED: uncharacterized protein LOC106815875 [Priapulus caudatus]